MAFSIADGILDEVGTVRQVIPMVRALHNYVLYCRRNVVCDSHIASFLAMRWSENVCPIGSINSIIICKYLSQLQRESLSMQVYNICTYDIYRHNRVKPKVLFL